MLDSFLSSRFPCEHPCTRRLVHSGKVTLLEIVSFTLGPTENAIGTDSETGKPWSLTSWDRRIILKPQKRAMAYGHYVHARAFDQIGGAASIAMY